MQIINEHLLDLIRVQLRRFSRVRLHDHLLAGDQPVQVQQADQSGADGADLHDESADELIFASVRERAELTKVWCVSISVHHARAAACRYYDHLWFLGLPHAIDLLQNESCSAACTLV